MPVTPETDVPPPQPPPPPHNQLSFICIEEEIYEDQSTATGAMNASEYCGCSIANSLQTTLQLYLKPFIIIKFNRYDQNYYFHPFLLEHKMKYFCQHCSYKYEKITNLMTPPQIYIYIYMSNHAVSQV